MFCFTTDLHQTSGEPEDVLCGGQTPEQTINVILFFNQICPGININDCCIYK